jgi:creatinine amidohydrolase/Fe(II)-dependent formamide hydrolase-like protein
MRKHLSGLVLMILGAAALSAGPGTEAVLRLAELNTVQIQALDRARTAVIIPGGILEEHGPYLPAYTDGYGNEKVATELAAAIVERRGWTALMFPSIPLGSSGANEIGGRYTFPGSYPVRPETVRAVYMDLATALGEQGFRWIFLVNAHGDPRHNTALEAAGDYFRDTYGGHMVHLMGIVIGTRASDRILPEATKAEDGFTVHAGVAEHSFTMAIRPDLIGRGIATAKSITGKDVPDLRRIASAEGWPGYFGAPRLASLSMGRKLLAAEVKVRTDIALRILDGADEQQFQRYSSMIAGVPGVREVMDASSAHDAALETRQRQWLAAHLTKPRD